MKNSKDNKMPAYFWQAVWDESSPISGAFYEFISQEKQKVFAALREVGGPEKNYYTQFESRMAQEKAKRQQGLANEKNAVIAVMDGLMDIQSKQFQGHHEKYEERKFELQAACARWINAGELIAVGYAEGHLPQALAFPVPEEYVSHGKYHWEENTISLNATNIVEVRVQSPKFIRKLMERHNIDLSLEDALASADIPCLDRELDEVDVSLPSLSDRPMSSAYGFLPKGRPSKRNVFWRAYIECRKQGLIDFQQPRITTYRTVITYIQKNFTEEYADGKGFGERAFLKLIKKDFDANSMKNKEE
jgi:hypothetical protein